MSIHVLRVWLPDRPGALGAVATRIGAVRGDVIGIDIIERGAGRAVDELVVDLPDETVVDLLVAEVREVEGVDVEDIRALDGPPEDPAVAALDVAHSIRDAFSEADAFESLVAGARRLLHATWAALVDPGQNRVVATDGKGLPTEGWLCAFVLGALAEGSTAGPDELAIAPIRGGKMALVVSRDHLKLRGREQDILERVASLI